MSSLATTILPWLLLPGLAHAGARAPRLAAAATLLVALAAASASLVLGAGSPALLAGRAPSLGVDGAYLSVNGAIFLAGLVLALLASRSAWTLDPWPVRFIALGGLALACATAWPLLRAGRPLVSLLGGAAAAAVAFAWSGTGSGTAPPDAALRSWRGVFRGVKGDLRLPVVLAALAMLLRDFGLSLLAIAALAALLHWTMPRHRPIDRLPVALLAAALTVGVAWLAWRAAGPDGLARAGLGDAPFSPAAQRIMAAALLLVGVILAGVPPFDRFVPGALLAPLAASLIGGAVLPGMPEGVEQWRGIVAPWLVVAAADAVRRRREALAAACAALFVIVAGDPGAATTGLLLAVAASAAELVPMVAWPSWRPWAARVLAALAVASFAGGLRQALGGEVVYSVAMTAVLLAGVLRGGTGATVAPPRETAQ